MRPSQEKSDAYWTLYECLLTTTKLIAPFVPFLAEAMWQNLAVEPFGGRAGVGRQIIAEYRQNDGWYCRKQKQQSKDPGSKSCGHCLSGAAQNALPVDKEAISSDEMRPANYFTLFRNSRITLRRALW